MVAKRADVSRSWPSHLKKNWFLIALLICVSLGNAFPNSLRWLAVSEILRTSIVATVMFAMALPISMTQVGQSLRRPWAALLAVGLNLLVLPSLAYLLSRWMSDSAGGGLIVAAAVPCTLASAAVWTRRAGGDDTVSIMVTLITSSTCFLVAPFWISWLLGKSVQVDAGKMIFDLAVSVLLPMLLAQVVNRFSPVQRFSDRHRESISIFCQIGILMMVLIGAVQIGMHSDENTRSSWQEFAGIILGSTVLHLSVLGLGWWLAEKLQFSRSQKIAVAIAGSQKTLMIGLKLAVDCGVSILPMIVYHLGQLIIDAALVERWSKHKTP